MNLFTDSKPEPNPQREALPVSRLLRRMRNLLEIEIGDIWVEGEVSNLRKQGSGHWYFSLKDDSGQIACAMFGARRRSGSELLEDGSKVRVFAEVTVYEARGTVQLVVKEVEAVGAGALQAQFEALKRKLDTEGLFAQSLKKPLPQYPVNIAIVTSGSSAALQDMINVLSRRAPWVTVHLMDVQVQGKGAERGIARGIERISNWEEEGLPQCDVVIVGRGGGSIEDLWNFNEEVVARAIADCSIPVVSAVGHEIDFTIADFVSDVRAPTPSAAAELVVPDQAEIRQRVENFDGRLKRRLEEGLRQREEALRYASRTVVSLPADSVLREPINRLDDAIDSLEGALEGGMSARVTKARSLVARWYANRPRAVLDRQEQQLEALSSRYEKAATVAIQRREAALERIRDLIKVLGPEQAFERGFSIMRTAEGKIVRSPEEVEKGELLETLFKDGSVSSRVE